MSDPPYGLRAIFDLPGLLSLSRVAMAFVFPWTIDRPWLALTLIAAAGVSDVLDGYCARRLGRSSPTGAALDPLTDKIFAASIVLTLLVTHRLSLGWVALLCLREVIELPLLLGLLFIPLARVLRAAHLKANWLGKLTTVLQFAALCALLFHLPYVRVWFVVTAIIGAIAGVSYWVSFRKAWPLVRAPAIHDTPA
jgi:phosphatidylglycerophosphate synthase